MRTLAATADLQPHVALFAALSHRRTHPELDQCARGVTTGDFEAARLDVIAYRNRLHGADIDGVRHRFLATSPSVNG